MNDNGVNGNGVSGRRARRLAVALLAAGAAVVGGAMPAGADGPTGSIGDVTTASGALQLTVSANGLPEGSALEPSSLAVTVDGRPVTATIASSSTTSTDRPRRVAVLAVDVSGSMAGAPLTAARAAAARFVSDVPADVQVGLVSFSDAARVVVAPTADHARVSAALASLRANGNTTLYDGLVLATQQLGTSGQRMLVVLSDGADTSSRASLAAATAVVRASGATTRLVAYRTDAAQTAKLQRLASDVGGKLVPAADGGQLLNAFGGAAGVFATQVDVTALLPDGLPDGQHRVSVTLTFGTTTISDTADFATAAPVVAPGQGGGTPVSGSTTPAPLRTSTLLPLLALVFVALLVLSLAVLVPREETESARSLRNLDVYAVSGAATVSRSDQTQQEQGGLTQTALGITDRFASRGLQERLAVKLDRADMRLKADEWLLICGCIGVGAVAVLALVAGNVLVGLVGGIALTWIGTHVYVSHRGKKRLAAFEETLPNTLQLVASSLQTGFSLPQAIDAASSDGQQPMAGELSRALAEARLGAPLEDGLDRVADRMDSQDLRWTVMAIRIQRHVGGNLSEVLHTTAKTMRDRAAMRRQVRALSAEGRLSAYILIALPILLAGYLFLTRRQYLSLLWSSTLGYILGGIAVLGIVVGWFWMRKLVDVEV